MFLTCNGPKIAHSLFLLQLITVALYGMLLKVYPKTSEPTSVAPCFLCYTDLYAIYFSGLVQQKLEGHLHYVQGVAWDPLGQYIASLSSDRTCRIYANKPQGKSKNTDRMKFVCQHTLVKAEHQNHDESKVCLMYSVAFFGYSLL